MELIYTLQTFGIPALPIPVDELGRMAKVQHIARMNAQRRLEEQASSSVMGGSTETETMQRRSSPGLRRHHTLRNNDVLMGRGCKTRNHVGNVRFRFLVE